MPAKSEAQRRFIYGVKGAAFAKAHHFDNRGPLPQRAASAKGKTMNGYGASSDTAMSSKAFQAGKAKPKVKKKKGGKRASHAKHGHTKPDGFHGLKMC